MRNLIRYIPAVLLNLAALAICRGQGDVEVTAAPSNPKPNLELNWTISRTFDASGAVTGETKTFFDRMGRVMQTQTNNVDAGHVFASQPLYDVGGRQVGSTMAAPISNAAFNYRADFLRGPGGTPFNYRSYSRFTSTSSQPDKTYNPDPVDTSGSIGTLGYYYSTRNTWERQQDHTDRPYSTSVTAKNGTDVFSNTGGVGRIFRIGGARTARQFTVPISRELDFYSLLRRTYFPIGEIGDTTLMATADKKMTVSVDADGRFTVSASIDGRTVMTARAGNDMVLRGEMPTGEQKSCYFAILDFQTVILPPGTLRDYFDNEYDSGSSSHVIKDLQPGLYQFSGSGSVSYRMGLSDVTFTFYDQLGRVRATIPPEGVKLLWKNGTGPYANLHSIPFVSVTRYDGKGNVVFTMDPDAGRSEFRYSSDGKLRYSQNALQKQGNRFSYTNYDSYGRGLESGELTPAGSFTFDSLGTAMLDATGLNSPRYPQGTKSDVTLTTFDNASEIPTLPGYVQDSYFLTGAAVATTAKYSGAVTASNLVSKTWYNYDGDGNILWMVKYLAGLGYKTMDYSYDELGNVTKSIYQKGTPAETFVHFFEYNKNKQLAAVHTATSDDPATKVIHARYIYSIGGQLKRVELGDKLQGIDYVYGIDGKLKSINNANAAHDPGRDGKNGFLPDVFAMNLDYHWGDYSNTLSGIKTFQGTGMEHSYSGLVSGMSWFTKKPSSTDLAPVMNIFKYDKKGQLRESTYGRPRFEDALFIPDGDVNRERGLSYDDHGNIRSLVRVKGTAADSTRYSYNYQPNTNRLLSVPGYATYTYDVTGQLSSQIKGTERMFLNYDVSGKVTGIFTDGARQNIMLSFVYDDAGNRVMKKDHRSGAVTWYSYDGTGSLAAVFEQLGSGPIQLTEQPVYGADRLGTYYRLGSSYQYTITDHLGNTRVVLNRNRLGNAADVVYYADYYPFGTELRSAGIQNRYGYQGRYAEKDKETGWNSFELRNYDAAIGRWLTTDPKSQFHSPYVGMGNNPIAGVDKDGGAVEPPDIIYKNRTTGEIIGRIKTDRDVVYWTDAFRMQDILPTASSSPILSAAPGISPAEAYLREHKYYLSQNFKNPDYNDLSRWSTSFAIVANAGEAGLAEVAPLRFAKLYRYIWPAASPVAAKGGKELFNFSTKAAEHMANPGRAVPVQILKQAIKGSKGLADPRGSRALMHTTEMFKNGKAYNLEVLYDKATNSIWHFKYSPIKP